MKLQLLMMKFMNFMADSGITTDENGYKEYKGTRYGKDTPDWVIKIIAPIIDVLNSLLIPVIILLGTAGTIYAIVLGVKYSKAETADAREEAKKQLINAAIGIVIMLVALILLKIFVANAPEIFNWVEDTSGTAPTEE